MAEIAAALAGALADRRQDGGPGRTSPRVVAQGCGWTVADVICTCGPQDRPFAEQHTEYAVALVVAGMFQHRGGTGPSLLTPGAVMLGDPGAAYECRHDHGSGDRAVAFWFTPDYHDSIAADAGARPGTDRAARDLPPRPETMPLVARAGAGLLDPAAIDWNELAVAVAARTIRLAARRWGPRSSDPRAVGRVAAIVRHIEQQAEEHVADDDMPPADRLSLDTLAALAGLSPYHFLRTFVAVAGETPHRFVRRARLRRAALALLAGRGRVIDAALDAGFADLSTFNRAFKAEFGASPRRFRQDATASDPIVGRDTGAHAWHR